MKGRFNKKIGFRDFGIQEVTPTTFHNPAGRMDIPVCSEFFQIFWSGFE